MAKSRKRDNGGSVVEQEPRDAGAPQRSGDTTAANSDRDRVAARAYELYLARGGSDGRDVDDWLEAERELGRGGNETNRGPESGS